MPNPFTPSFGAVPMYPAGRSNIIYEMNRAFDSWQSDPGISSLFIGPRGSGKTALLAMIADEARMRGWLVIHCAAGPGMNENIYQKMILESSELLGTESKIHINSLTLGKTVGLTLSKDSEHDYSWENRMDQLIGRINEEGAGVLIALDEVSISVDELPELVSAYQVFRRNRRKISLIMAGLPGNVYNLLNTSNVTFLRRANQYILGRIDDADIRQTFRKTVECEGKTISDSALNKAVSAIGGYPYMMQLIGFYVWEESRNDTREITASQTDKGIEIAREKFKTGVLESTYRNLSDGDIAFLFAMLEDPEYSLQKNIAARLKKTSAYVSTYKKRLLQEGIIEESAGRRITIILPFFREYLQEQKDLSEQS